MRCLLCVLAACGPRPPQSLDRCWKSAVGTLGARVVIRDGTITQGGTSAPITSWLRGDGSTRDDYALGPQHQVQVVTGGRAWSRAGQARPRELAGDELRTTLAEAAADTYTALATVVDARHLALPGGITLAIDPATCLPETRTRMIEGTPWTATYDGWDHVDGVALPHHIRYTGGDPRAAIDVVYTRSRMVEDSLAATFTRPDVAPYPFPPGVHALDIPLRIDGNTPLAEVRINDKPPLWMIVDTGADISHVDAARARELGLAVTGSVSAGGAGGTVEAGLIARPALAAGALRLTLDTMQATPLAGIPGVDGHSLEGILGYDVLGAFVVELDAPNRRLRLHDPTAFAMPPGATVVPMTFWSSKPVIDVALTLPDGTELPLRAVVDTGSSNALMIRSPVVVKHALDRVLGAAPEARAGAGVGGETRARPATAPLRIGTLAVGTVPVLLSTATTGTMASTELDANVGGAILSRFTLIVDYSRMRIGLVSSAAP